MSAILASVALKSTAVVLIAWTFAFLFRRRSAAIRHLAWTAAAAALLALPFLSLSLPTLPVSGVLPAATTALFTVTSATGEGARSAAAPASAGTTTAPRRIDWPLLIALAWALGTIVSLA